MSEAVIAASLLKPIFDLWKLLGGELERGSEAEMQLRNLKMLIGVIRQDLNKAYSKEVISEDLKRDMKQMRKFLYDAEDAVDDFMEFKNSNWEGLGLYICKYISRRTLASEARRIEQMVKNWKTKWDTSNTLCAAHAMSSSACHESLPIAFSNERDDELVGIEAARDKLVKCLTADVQRRKVIFVHGTQGIGKTSLVGSVLRQEEVRNFFSSYVWINLRSYELVDNKAAALKKANAEIWDRTKDSLESQLLEEVFKQKKNDRWLLVLDDAGSTHVFEFLQSLLAQTHLRMLVTTRDSSLASRSRTIFDSRMAQSDDGPLEPLYDIWHFKHPSLFSNDSLTLLCWKMFRMRQPPEYFEGIVDSIKTQCGGLPLAILAASNLLSDIQGGVNGIPQRVELIKLSRILGEALLSKGDISDQIRRMITLRMDQLHDVHACLFYLSIFPLDHSIKCSTLMRLWMAERFIEQKAGKPVQTIAEETLKKLVDHNLFQKVEKTGYERAKTCCIYNILHQIIISKSKDDEFAMIVADPEEKWPETIWRLSFHSKIYRLKDNMKVKRLRSLLVFEDMFPDFMEELLGQVSRLKVLNFQCRSLNYFPRTILHLRYLRYLSLRDTAVNNIVDDIGDLKYLETLDLKGTSVTKLPKGILKLKALRHLLVYRSNRNPAADSPKYGVKVPSQLGCLTSLQKLCLIELKQVKQSVVSKLSHREKPQLLEQLGNLENLRRLGISNLRHEHVENLCSSIEKLEKLETIHIIAARDGGTLDLSKVDESRASPFLQRVHLTGTMATLPKWILSHNLTKLLLKRSQLNEDPLQHFRGLLCLKHLDLQEAFCNVQSMIFQKMNFQQLHFLGLATFHDLHSIEIKPGALPALQRLSLAQCNSLTRLPQGIILLEQCKRIEISEMPGEFKTAIGVDGAVSARTTVVEKIWKNEAVVECTLKSPTDCPVTNRPSTASMK